MPIPDYAGPGLLPSMFEPCTRLVCSVTEPTDGHFGREEAWTDGDSLDLMIVKNSSPEVIVAERQGIREQYTVVCRRGTILKRGDVLRRDKSGETLIVKSTPDDQEAPDASTIQIAKCQAERWQMPDPPTQEAP